jgi:very-short-patch-repair endonuclease
MSEARTTRSITPPGRFAATLPVEGREGASRAKCASDPSVGSKSSATIARARALRKRLTGPEAKLWRHLSRIKTVETHFRKQVPIGPYVADFACMRARLIIEVDGDQHGWDNGRARDAARTKYLQAKGFRVLRFWNNEVLQEMEAVVETIYAALYGASDARPISLSKRGGTDGRAPSSPSTGEVVRRSRTGGGEHD